MSESYRFTVRGRVQGVGFRWSAVRRARQLGLAGWVRNCADGSVEGYASGDGEALASFRDWLQRGPPAASVAGLEWIASEPEVLSGFETR